MSQRPCRCARYGRGPTRVVWVIACAALVGLTRTVAAAQVLTVIPDVDEPYRSVLIQMVDGIRQTTSLRLLTIDAAPTTAADDVASLPTTGERVVIALGSAAIRSAGPLTDRIPVVVGAIVAPTGQPPLPGISLLSDPEALFAEVVRLRPGIRTIHWLYAPSRGGWLLERAQAGARKHKLILAAVVAKDARSAAQHYQEILGKVDSATDAVWLSQDPALVGADAALPDILEQAWARNVVVFSGSFQHVAQGVLFALFPDNVAMGADLARLALAHADGAAVEFVPNRGLRRAINRRTAEHLGIDLQLRNDDVVLPAR